MIAIDHSGRLLDAALKIQHGKSLEMKDAKDLPLVNISLDEIEANIDRVQFQQVSVQTNERMSKQTNELERDRSTNEQSTNERTTNCEQAR